MSQSKTEARACPRCGDGGQAVADETILAILKPGLAAPLLAHERRLCRRRSCAVLYYGAGGIVVEKGAATTRVGLKEAEDPIPLCYCFGFSRADVRSQVAEQGGSDIPARIAAGIRGGGCDCRRKNPSGRCCLAEVEAAVREAKEGPPIT